MVPFADQHVEIPSMSAGNIALTVGLKQVELDTSHDVFAFSFRKVVEDYWLPLRPSQGTPSYHPRLQQQLQPVGPAAMVRPGRKLGSSPLWSSRG